MQIYLVGGAVRDHLLGLAVSERDYVVVGATPERMTELGYVPVGSDFPVFLHPESKEEYALARTERKNGHGYAGFDFFANPAVSLEEDLLRRDLTINAMAMDETGNIIDPYAGQQDLADKVLRHVSDAFVEDPLRVLRVARFAAKLAPLGFTIAPDTLALMRSISDAGELSYLKVERIYKELSRAIMCERGEVFVDVLYQCGALKSLFPEIHALFGVPQRPEYHPEIDCGIHALMSLRQACVSGFPLQVRFAALIHDLGKALTPADVLPRHTNHEMRGVAPVTNVCQRLKVPKDIQLLAVNACRDHLLMHQLTTLRPVTLLNLLKRLDYRRRPEQVEDFVRVCWCDATGRTGFESKPYPQAKQLVELAATLRAVDISDLVAQHEGSALVDAIEAKLISTITYVKSQVWPQAPRDHAK